MEQVVSSRSSARTESGFPNTQASSEANSSGVSWSGVIAGAFVSAALGLILLALGAGLGLSSVSFGSDGGASVGKAAIVWLIILEIISSSMGGYLAGRLRTKWTSVHSDEVYFRDTAHGFLAWSVALVITAAFLTSAAASMMGSTSGGGLKGASGAQAESHSIGPNAYFVDSLLRSADTKTDSDSGFVRSEVEVILANDLRFGELPAGDRNYLAQLVATRTGTSQADAENRVTSVYADAQQAAEAARKALAHSLLWTFLALLIGAFCASLAATIGGRQRDHLVAV